MSAPPTTSEPVPFSIKLERTSRLCVWGLPALGMLHAARALLLSPDGPGLAVLDALYWIGAYILAGQVLSGVFRILERRLASQPLASPARSLPLPSPDGAAGLDKERMLAEIRHAIRGGEWDEAGTLIEGFATDHADDPGLSALRQELQSARESARDNQMAQLEAARKVNDPDRVLELHESLAPLLEPEARNALDAELSKWFLRLIHNRLRTGKIQTDLAHLAGRIAEAFSQTVEGASLRASLPTLRRSAGLCPRCAQPYSGVGDACPACLGLGHSPAPPPAS